MTVVRAEPSIDAAAIRELPLRDLRDLALAVVEGAVAAESLATELKRSPDRSRHFRDIAERLRAIVGRPSVRSALAEDAPPAAHRGPPAGATESKASPEARASAPPLSVQRPVAVGHTEAATVPPPAPTSPDAAPVPLDAGVDASPPSLPQTPELDPPLRAVVELATKGLEALPGWTFRLARIEQLVADAVASASSGEHLVVRSSADVLALAAKLSERVAQTGAVDVRWGKSSE